MYVKSTQTDAVATEPHGKDDEDEDEAVVQVVSSQPVTSPPEPDKVSSVAYLNVSQCPHSLPGQDPASSRRP